MINELEEKSRKRKIKRRRRRLLSLLSFVLLLVYIPAIWKWVFSVNHETNVIRTATLEVKTPIEGILIRKELLLKAPGTGILFPSIQNGERVAKGSEVASYVQSSMREVVESYRQSELEILKRVVAEFDNSTGTEREMWESAIETQISRLTGLANTGDLTEAEDIRQGIDRILEARARYMLENNTASDRLKNEKKELERLRSNVKKSVNSIYSPESGIVLYKPDGFEETFSYENRDNIKKEDISRVLAENSRMEKTLTPSEINVIENEAFGKLISNDEGWIVFSVPEKEGKDISVLFEKAKLNDKEILFNIELEGVQERIPVTLEKVGEISEGFQFLTARMNKMIEKTMDYRGVKGYLVINSVTGMKVPLKSLFNINTVDDTADIAILEMEKTKFVRVRIVARQDNNAIIENIDTSDAENCVNIFDVFLVNPKNVVEGQVIER
ncbi:MAG: HlyD family efflux transporter periplasmic adaptor subunit [Acetivibrionales bacterium]|jgi:hypothetical protein